MVKELRLLRDTLKRCFEEIRVLFHINAYPLQPLKAFPYLGRTITYNNIYWPAVFQNLKKAQRQWGGGGGVFGVLANTGATLWARGIMYKSVPQPVLLYVSEIWLVTGAILKVLEWFHHWVARRVTGMTAKRVAGEEW